MPWVPKSQGEAESGPDEPVGKKDKAPRKQADESAEEGGSKGGRGAKGAGKLGKDGGGKAGGFDAKGKGKQGKDGGKDFGKKGGKDDGGGKGGGGKAFGGKDMGHIGKGKDSFKGSKGGDGFGGKDFSKGSMKGGKGGDFHYKGHFDDDAHGGKGRGGWPGRDDDMWDGDGRRGDGFKGSKGGPGKGKDKSSGDGGGKGAALDKPDRPNRSEDARRQVLVEKGQQCEVKKHSSMGCALVTLTDPRARQAILEMLGAEATISGTTVKLKPHHDKETDRDVPTDIFVGWGRQVEKATPVSEADIVKFFDQMYNQVLAAGRLNDPARASPSAALASLGIPPAPPPLPGAPGGASQQAAAVARQAYLAQMQQYQYYMYQQQQQQQQQALAYYQYYNQARQVAAVAAAGGCGQKGGQKGGQPGYDAKAACRYPTDEEVKNRLQRLQHAASQADPIAASPAAAESFSAAG